MLYGVLGKKGGKQGLIGLSGNFLPEQQAGFSEKEFRKAVFDWMRVASALRDQMKELVNSLERKGDLDEACGTKLGVYRRTGPDKED